jgi:hypothetical protein
MISHLQGVPILAVFRTVAMRVFTYVMTSSHSEFDINPGNETMRLRSRSIADRTQRKFCGFSRGPGRDMEGLRCRMTVNHGF